MPSLIFPFLQTFFSLFNIYQNMKLRKSMKKSQGKGLNKVYSFKSKLQNITKSSKELEKKLSKKYGNILIKTISRVIKPKLCATKGKHTKVDKLFYVKIKQ